MTRVKSPKGVMFSLCAMRSREWGRRAGENRPLRNWRRKWRRRAQFSFYGPLTKPDAPMNGPCMAPFSCGDRERAPPSPFLSAAVFLSCEPSGLRIDPLP